MGDPGVSAAHIDPVFLPTVFCHFTERLLGVSNGASGSGEWKHMDKETAGRQDQQDDGGTPFLALPLPRPEGRYRNSKLDMGV